jgi:hypothetical protein
MLDVIMIVPQPVTSWNNVVDRESFLSDGVPMERMIGTLPALVESIQWLKMINPDREPPCKLIVIVNGGVRDDMVEIDSFLKSLDFDWFVAQNDVVETEARCLELAVNEIKHEFVALCPATTLIRETKWMEKMQVVYNKDRNCCMVGTDNEIRDNNFPPYKLPVRQHPTGGLVLMRKNILPSLDYDGMDPEQPLQLAVSKSIEKIRGNRWVAPSVRFSDQAWSSIKQEKSVTVEPSGSPSQTIPD